MKEQRKEENEREESDVLNDLQIGQTKQIKLNLINID